MNSIIFVMMVYTQANQWIPSALVFTSRDKCETAARSIHNQITPHLLWARPVSSHPWCAELPRDGMVLPK